MNQDEEPREKQPFSKVFYIVSIFAVFVMSILIYGVYTGEIREITPEEAFDAVAEKNGIKKYTNFSFAVYEYPMYITDQNDKRYIVVLLHDNYKKVFKVHKTRLFSYIVTEISSEYYDGVVA